MSLRKETSRGFQNLKDSNDLMLAKMLRLLNKFDLGLEALTKPVPGYDEANAQQARSLLETVMVNPKARLYSRENFRGEHEDYDLELDGGCYKLTYLNGKVRSIDTNGTCIRLFLNEACVGWSAAVYPGSGNSRKVRNGKLTGVTSVGPCAKDEFRGAKTIQTVSGEEIVKDSNNTRNYFPDLVEFDSWRLYQKGVILPDSVLTPMKGYLFGSNGRLEYVTAFINQHHLNLSQEDTGFIQNSTYWASIDKQEGDTVGFAIPLKIGGPADVTYNAFPQTRQNAAEWNQITDFIPGCMEANPGSDLWITVLFMYPNAETRRPHLFNFRIRCAQFTQYGFVRN